MAGKVNAPEAQMEHKINFHLNLIKTVVKDHPCIFIKINILFGGYLDRYTSELDTPLFYSNWLHLFFIVGSTMDHILISFIALEIVPCGCTAQVQRQTRC